jgi:hypothetical protein
VAFWRRLRAENRPRATFQAGPSLALLNLLATAEAGADTATRAEALSVPAVQRGRNMICSIATLPLIQIGPDRERVRNPLLAQFDVDVPNVVVLSQTLEDLVFDGISWWEVTATDFPGYPISVRHLDVGSVAVHAPGSQPAPLPSGIDPRGATVWVNGVEVPAARVIRFDSPNPGVLRVGGRPIRRAILLDQAAALYAEEPRPLDYFTDREDADPLGDDEIADLLPKWKAWRQERVTAYVPWSLEYRTVDSPSPADLQLAQLQKQVTLELANLFGLDPEDLGISTTTRTYQNAVDRRRDRINDVLAPYMRALTDRLSMGDVTRRGHLVTFDLDDYMKANPTERVEFYRAMVEMGAMDAAEVRAAEDLPEASTVPDVG